MVIYLCVKAMTGEYGQRGQCDCFNCIQFHKFEWESNLTRFNKIAIQGTPQMAVDKEAICLSRVYSYYPKCNFPLFYV